MHFGLIASDLFLCMYDVNTTVYSKTTLVQGFNFGGALTV